jgi:hypothetical protein
MTTNQEMSTKAQIYGAEIGAVGANNTKQYRFRAKGLEGVEYDISITAWDNSNASIIGQAPTIHETISENDAKGVRPWYDIKYVITEGKTNKVPNGKFYNNMTAWQLSKDSPAPEKVTVQIPQKSDAVRGLEQGNANNVAGLGIASYVSNPNNKEMELPPLSWLKEYAASLNYLSDSIVEGRNAKDNGEEEEPEESIEEPDDSPGNEPGELDI